jgi:hypothetical protein
MEKSRKLKLDAIMNSSINDEKKIESTNNNKWKNNIKEISKQKENNITPKEEKILPKNDNSENKIISSNIEEKIEEKNDIYDNTKIIEKEETLNSDEETTNVSSDTDSDTELFENYTVNPYKKEDSVLKKLKKEEKIENKFNIKSIFTSLIVIVSIWLIVIFIFSTNTKSNLLKNYKVSVIDTLNNSNTNSGTNDTIDSNKKNNIDKSQNDNKKNNKIKQNCAIEQITTLKQDIEVKIYHDNNQNYFEFKWKKYDLEKIILDIAKKENIKNIIKKHYK